MTQSELGSVLPQARGASLNRTGMRADFGQASDRTSTGARPKVTEEKPRDESPVPSHSSTNPFWTSANFNDWDTQERTGSDMWQNSGDYFRVNPMVRAAGGAVFAPGTTRQIGYRQQGARMPSAPPHPIDYFGENPMVEATGGAAFAPGTTEQIGYRRQGAQKPSAPPLERFPSTPVLTDNCWRTMGSSWDQDEMRRTESDQRIYLGDSGRQFWEPYTQYDRSRQSPSVTRRSFSGPSRADTAQPTLQTSLIPPRTIPRNDWFQEDIPRGTSEWADPPRSYRWNDTRPTSRVPVQNWKIPKFDESEEDSPRFLAMVAQFAQAEHATKTLQRAGLIGSMQTIF